MKAKGIEPAEGFKDSKDSKGSKGAEEVKEEQKAAEPTKPKSEDPKLVPAEHDVAFDAAFNVLMERQLKKQSAATVTSHKSS